MKLINIGFGNMVNADRVIGIVSPDSAPIKRLVQDAREKGALIDASYGRRTQAVLIMDSDHVILLDDEIQRIMDEVILNNYQDRTFIALDYFDASINRVAAWAVGMRNARKAILSACLAPASIRDAEHKGDLTSRLALMEERKTLPFGAIWDYYCMKQDAGVGTDWLAKVKQYETDVLSKR